MQHSAIVICVFISSLLHTGEEKLIIRVFFIRWNDLFRQFFKVSIVEMSQMCEMLNLTVSYTTTNNKLFTIYW